MPQLPQLPQLPQPGVARRLGFLKVRMTVRQSGVEGARARPGGEGMRTAGATPGPASRAGRTLPIAPGGRPAALKLPSACR